MDYIIAHDFGTSSAKAALFTVDGKMVRSNTVSYPVYREHSTWAEQDPEDWWKAFCANNKILLDGIDKSSALCVSFSGTCPNCLCVDDELKPLHKAIIWQDNRATAESSEIIERLPPELLDGRGVLGPSRTLVALQWIRKNWPDVFQKTAKVIGANSHYVLMRLAGRAMTDTDIAWSMAMATPDRSGWSYDLLKLLDIPESMLPELHRSTDVVATVPANIADECGLAPGTRLVIGASDGYCSSVGTGMIKSGDVCLNAGTSGGVGAIGLDGKKVNIRGTSSTGAAMVWLKNVFCAEEEQIAASKGEDVFSLIDEKIDQAPIGSNGVMFHPYLQGERGVLNNPSARGSFVGLSLSTTREDIMRSVIEGIGFNLNLCMQHVRDVGVVVKRAPFIGGMSKGKNIRQTFADIMNVELVTMENSEFTAAKGAAVLGGIGIGVYRDISEIEKFNSITSLTIPNPEHHERYKELISLYEKVYEAQEPLYPLFHS